MMQSDTFASGSMGTPAGSSPHASGSTRRDFLLRSALAAAAPAAGIAAVQAATSTTLGKEPTRRPNIIFYHSDQFRWDCVCAAGLNPMDFTPNLDAMYRRGTVFSNFITNQPLCIAHL